MAGMFRKIKEDGRLRRTMAAWLGICIVVQMVFGSLGAVRTYAGDTIYKVISHRLQSGCESRRTGQSSARRLFTECGDL